MSLSDAYIYMEGARARYYKLLQYLIMKIRVFSEASLGLSEPHESNIYMHFKNWQSLSHASHAHKKSKSGMSRRAEPACKKKGKKKIEPHALAYTIKATKKRRI